MRCVQIGLMNTEKVAIDLSSVRVKHAVNLIMTNALVVFVYAIFGDVIVMAVVPMVNAAVKSVPQICVLTIVIMMLIMMFVFSPKKRIHVRITNSLYPYHQKKKKKFLGDKYCDDGIAADDIYKKMLTYVDNNLDPNSINLDELELSCDDFNKSTYYREDTDVSAIGRKLKLCKNNGNKKGHQKFNKYRKNKKKKNKNSKSE
jgi:hypothetical protein